MTGFDGESGAAAGGAFAVNQERTQRLADSWNVQVGPPCELLSLDRAPVERQELNFSGLESVAASGPRSARRPEPQRHVVLDEDAEIVALAELPESISRQIAGAERDFVLIRPYAAIQVIDAGTAALLEQFRYPTTIVDAILAYSRKIHVRPSEVLEYAFPLIQGFILGGVLARAAGGPL